MPTVIGVDSSTQSCKVLVVDVDSGEILSEARTEHPDGTEIDPELWWAALQSALDQVDTSDVEAISIGAQQHGLVALDASGEVVRPALLWNDTRSAPQAEHIIAEFSAANLAERTGSVPVASFTSSKLAWVRQHEPQLAAKIAAVALPHDWLTWRLRGYGPKGDSRYGPQLEQLVTDRSDASGTGYFSPITNSYDDQILDFVLGHRPVLPKVLGAGESAGKTENGWIVGPGGGDNAIAALGLETHVGDVVMSLGTSGTVFAATSKPANDATGTVGGFADAAGGFLPLVATLNASRPIDSVRQLLGLSWEQFSSAVKSAAPGSGGLTLLPFFDGERTPNLPDATGLLGGISRFSLTPANMARASVEGVVSNLSHGLEAIVKHTEKLNRLMLIGGGAQNFGVQHVVSQSVSLPVIVPEPGEYVAFGAAKQAAWVLTGKRPGWELMSRALPTGDIHSAALNQFDDLLEKYVENTD
jgi:xylulokinase